jgi:hypothetical protein
MSRCENCGSFVTGEFVRVFGSNEGQVYGCPDCTPSPDRHGGDAARRA